MVRYISALLIPTLVLACCPPRKWEGIEYVAIGSTDSEGKQHYTELRQMVSVDYDRRMVYANQTSTTDGVVNAVTVLQNYNTATQFVTTNGQCQKMGVTTLEPSCVPQNATVVEKSYMGAGNSRIAVTMYRFQEDMMTSYATMADDGCIPVAYEASGQTAKGDKFQMTVEMFGITAGIRDPKIFNEPVTCGTMAPSFVGVGVGRR